MNRNADFNKEDLDYINTEYNEADLANGFNVNIRQIVYFLPQVFAIR